MKSKKPLLLLFVIVLIVGSYFIFDLMNRKSQNTANPFHSTETKESSESSVIQYSSVSETSYSREPVELSTQELTNYREQIEKAGYDSTLFNDQEIQKMADELSESHQSVSDYLKNQTDKKTDDNEIKQARKELLNAGIDADKMHDNEIIALLKKAKKENKTIVEIAKNN
jgi:hypothetical protein